MRLRAVLLLALLAVTSASEVFTESCIDRCENGFDSTKKCQCDSMCKYYKSCCSDYESTCGMMTRGDTFVIAEDDELFDSTTLAPRRSAHDHGLTATSQQQGSTERPIPDFSHPETHQGILEMSKAQQTSGTRTPGGKDIYTTVALVQEEASITKATRNNITTAEPITAPATTAAPDPDAEVCSERPFDSFMQLKNGSIYAFRGEYFFVLDQKSVLPGYPKLIKDVWGISGPINAAFTRMNCQGKTYIFKGNKYWRFDNWVLDDDYPRDISVGFDKIPDYVDAAFALPAPGHNGKEKVFFFKGEQYYVYEFIHQPSHQECIGMTERSPSTLFRRYTDVYYSNYEHFFSELFADVPQHHDHHHFIDKDWKGLKSPVDAAMAGRIYVSPLRFTPGRNYHQPDQQWGSQQNQQSYQQYGQQWNQQYGWGRRRQSRSPSWETIAERGMNMGQDLAQRGMEMGMRLAERQREMEERLGRDWMRSWNQDWDQDRRRDRYGQNNRGNYDSRDIRGNDRFWDVVQRTQPIQTVYFFKADKYYRVDLRSKRVDPAMPPYPRSIAKYWLGCSDTAGAEK